MATLGFDVYGTLIDTAGIVEALRPYAGNRAGEFSSFWRAKQLEYAFRRGLMQNYRDFSVCTEQALHYTCLHFGTPIPAADRARLMAAYRELPAYPDAKRGLERLEAAGLRLFAFSMGRSDDVEHLLERSGLLRHFGGVVSLQEAKLFKPSPAAYNHFLRTVGASPGDAWLVSGNPFDVIGAVTAGLHGAWVKRSPHAVFDPWEIEPTVTVDDLADLADAVTAYHRT